ncbi:MAG: methyltransferase domain-containing protein, partial [Planctomycetota bacterium]
PTEYMTQTELNSTPVNPGANSSFHRPGREMAIMQKRISNLGPWRMSIQITPQINTGQFVELPKNAVECRRVRHKGRTNFLKMVDLLYPDGFKNKRFLDCGCNAGAFCFWVRERLAEIAFGFDIRDHWIKQARFVKAKRNVAPTNRIQFEILDLYDLESMELDPFDFVQFRGLFYHLHEPVHGLRLAADLCSDVLLFTSSFLWDHPDGSLKFEACDHQPLHGGVSPMNWFPTGPGICGEILKSLGFEDLKLTKIKQVKKRPERGRLEIIAARDKGRLKLLDGTAL